MVGNLNLTINPRLLTAGGDAQVKAMGHAAQAVGAVGESQTRTLEEKFAAIARLGDQVSDMGWRMFEVDQETRAHRETSRLNNQISEWLTDYQTNPEWQDKDIQADYAKKVQDFLNENGKGIWGIHGARFKAEAEGRAVRGFNQVRVFQRKQQLAEASAMDDAAKEAAYRSLAMPGIGPDERLKLAETEKVRVQRLGVKGLLNQGQVNARLAEINKNRALGDLDELLPLAPEAFAGALADPHTPRQSPEAEQAGADLPGEEMVRRFVVERLPWLDQREIKAYHTSAVTTWEKQVRTKEGQEAALERAVKARQEANYMAAISYMAGNPRNWNPSLVQRMEAQGKINSIQAERLEKRIEAREKGYTKADEVRIRNNVLAGACTEDELDEDLARAGLPPDIEESILRFAKDHIGRETPEVKEAIRLTDRLIAEVSPYDQAGEDQEKRLKIQMMRQRVYQMIWARADRKAPVTSTDVLVFVNEVDPPENKKAAFDSAPNPLYGNKGDLAGALQLTTRILDQEKLAGATRQRIRELQREVAKVTALIKLQGQANNNNKVQSSGAAATGRQGGGGGVPDPREQGKKSKFMGRGY